MIIVVLNLPFKRLCTGDSKDHSIGFGILDGETGGDTRARWKDDILGPFMEPNLNNYWSNTLGFSVGSPISYTYKLSRSETFKLE